MTPNKQGTEKCECGGWDDHGYQHEPFCPAREGLYTKSPVPTKEELTKQDEELNKFISPQGDTPEWESQFDKEFTGDTGYTDVPVFVIKDFIHKLQQEAHKQGYRLGEKNGMKAISNETKMRIEKAVAQERQEIVKMVRGMQSVCEETMQGDELQTIVRTCSAVIENIIQRGTKSAEK